MLRHRIRSVLTRSAILRTARFRQSTGKPSWADKVPSRLASWLGVNAPVVRPLRVEIGSGPRPTPGYLHIDIDPKSAHLEHCGVAWVLPIPDEAVTEIMAVHVLEHVPPSQLMTTLREWHRVLVPGGTVRIHVPNATKLLMQYLAGDRPTKWAVMAAIFGRPTDPDLFNEATVLANDTGGDHLALYDFDMLTSYLNEAGFTEIEDLSQLIRDRHTTGWEAIYGITDLSLVVQGRRALTP